MFDWVPLQNYTAYFDFAILIFIFITLWQCHTGQVLKKEVATINGTIGIVFIVLLILYMGLRPISSAFGDTMNYAKSFYEVAASKKMFEWYWGKEWGFHNLSNLFAKYFDIHSFFLLCAILYIVPLWLACIRIFKNYYFIPLLVIFCMFTFWQYGVNGIRNGIGASLFILALTYVRNIPVMIGLAFLGTAFHNSVYLMIGAATITWFIKNSYYYLVGWILSVGISYAVGGRLQSYFATLGIFGEDDRFSGYLTGSNMVGEIVQMSMVFRWDFLLYSAIGVAVGYYFIFRKNYKDEYYHWLYNTYLVTNGFWVLIIRAAYSNRFAQISWFILPLVLVYPFMRKRFWQNQEKVLAGAILVFYAYGFYTNIIQTNALAKVFSF